jgi:hypothetical protein
MIVKGLSGIGTKNNPDFRAVRRGLHVQNSAFQWLSILVGPLLRGTEIEKVDSSRRRLEGLLTGRLEAHYGQRIEKTQAVYLS